MRVVELQESLIKTTTRPISDAPKPDAPAPAQDPDAAFVVETPESSPENSSRVLSAGSPTTNS